jgi:hypothetical protein
LLHQAISREKEKEICGKGKTHLDTVEGRGKCIGKGEEGDKGV